MADSTFFFRSLFSLTRRGFGGEFSKTIGSALVKETFRSIFVELFDWRRDSWREITPPPDPEVDGWIVAEIVDAVDDVEMALEEEDS